MKFKYIILLITYIVISSCSEDIKQGLTDDIISLKLNINDKDRNSSTFNNYKNSLENNSELGISIFAINADKKIEVYKDNYLNIRSINSGDIYNQKWDFYINNNILDIYLSDKKGFITAHSPFKNDIFSFDFQHNIPFLNLTSDTLDILYGYSSNYINSANNFANINLNHALSLINFSFTAENEYSGDCIIEKITVKNTKYKQQLNLIKDELVNNKIKSDISLFYYLNNNFKTINPFIEQISFKGISKFGKSIFENGKLIFAGNFHFFSIPFNEISSLSSFYLAVIIDGITDEIPFPNNSLINNLFKVNWEKGKIYNYIIIIKADTSHKIKVI